MKREAIIGILLILVGIGIYIYYDYTIKPEKEAKELLVEGQIAFERGTRDTINNSINLFSKVIAKYPKTKVSNEAYYYIGQSYEKLGLNRLAYLKYLYIMKSGNSNSREFNDEIKTRIARLNINKEYTEEGVNQLLGMLNQTDNRDLRSRIYTELGHAYSKNGDYAKSRRMFDIALTENGSNEEAIIGKANSYKRLGSDDKAYDLYEQFLKYYGNFSHFSGDIRNSYLEQVFNSGMYSYRNGKYYPAISFFNRLLRYFPWSAKTEDALYWIGESYFKLENYEAAVNNFDRVLMNSYTHRNEDARMKKGQSYFLAKRFDLALKEFQTYMDDYPSGRFYKNAKKWKSMSSKEIMYRIKDDKGKDAGRDEEERDDSSDIKEDKSDYSDDGSRSGYDVKESRDKSKGVRSDVKENSGDRLKLDNVAEM